MPVEIREIILTARVTEPAPIVHAAAEDRSAHRALIDTCLEEVRRLLDRRAER